MSDDRRYYTFRVENAVKARKTKVIFSFFPNNYNYRQTVGLRVTGISLGSRKKANPFFFKAFI